LPQHSSLGKQHSIKTNTATFAANLLETEQAAAYTVQYISQQTQHISFAQTITFQQKQHISRKNRINWSLSAHLAYKNKIFPAQMMIIILFHLSREKKSAR
jgi:creatinine amidohydrolase/Fe(II)-dependent formamide hydrolase-like protein